MNIIVIDEEFPYPADTGKRIRSFNLLSRLAQKHTLYYIGYGVKESDAYREFERQNMHPIPVTPQIPSKSGIGFYGRLVANLFSTNPYIVDSHYSEIFEKTLYDTIEKVQPDIILSEWSPYAVFLKKRTDAKHVIVAHNIEHRIWQRYYDNESFFAKKWYIKKQLDKLTTFEHKTFKEADGVTVVSAQEKDYLTNFCQQTQIQVVDNGVDLDYFHPSDITPDPKRLVFVGSMNWRPNQDAVQFFVNDIFPLVKKEIPDLVVDFVGKEPPKSLLKYDEIEGINIVGGVPDVRPYVNKASLYIVPLRIGGGTRLKILEALSMKIPIVSTTVGAEGLHVTDRKNILLADKPEKFAEDIVAALTDKSLREKLAGDGLELVQRQYSWDSIAETLDTFLCKLCGE